MKCRAMSKSLNKHKRANKADKRKLQRVVDAALLASVASGGMLNTVKQVSQTVKGMAEAAHKSMEVSTDEQT